MPRRACCVRTIRVICNTHRAGVLDRLALELGESKMGTRLSSVIMAGLTVIGTAAGAAEQVRTSPQAAVSATAGQGGYIAVSVRPARTFYSFTGQTLRASADREWQHQTGPTLLVGNARIILPWAR